MKNQRITTVIRIHPSLDVYAKFHVNLSIVVETFNQKPQMSWLHHEYNVWANLSCTFFSRFYMINENLDCCCWCYRKVQGIVNANCLHLLDTTNIYFKKIIAIHEIVEILQSRPNWWERSWLKTNQLMPCIGISAFCFSPPSGNRKTPAQHDWLQ